MTGGRGHSLWRVVLAVSLGVLVLGLLMEWPFGTGPATVARIQDRDHVKGEQGFDRLFAEGVRHLRAGTPKEAILSFGQAHRLRPGMPEVHVNLGYAYLALDRIEAARSSFGAALDLRPGQVNAYYGLAVSLERVGDLEAALGAMRSYVHLSPDEDPFKRKGQAAIWEWQHALATAEGGQDAALPGAPADGPSAVLAKLPLRDIGGRNIVLESFAGKTVVLNVWATWCAPCRAELPSLQALSERLDPAAYAVIGVSVDEEAAFVREFLHDVGVDFPNFLDPSGRVTTAELEVTSYPQTLVIGPGGVLRLRVVGQREWATDDMLALIAAAAKSSERAANN